MEQLDHIGHDHGLVLIVGNENGGQTQFLMDLPDAGLQGLAKLGINGGQGLVQQQDLGMGDNGTGQGNPLLLTAGQTGGILVFLAFQLHQFHRPADMIGNFIFGHFLHFQSETNVLFHRHVGEQRVLLKDHADIALAGGNVGYILPVQDDGAFRDLLQAGQTPQKGGLAAAGGTQKGYQISFFNIQLDMVQDHIVPEPLDNILK